VRRIIVWGLGGITFLALLLAGALFLAIRSLSVVKVTEDLHMITGLGGNVGVLATGDGTVVVDTMTFAMQGARIRALAERLTGEPVGLVINSHYHVDHTHGNPGFAAGTRVVSTTRTLERLRSLDAEYWQAGARDLLPNDTFDHEHEIRMGDKTIRLLHPGRGHTDGDLVALFVEDQAIHMGDLLFNHRYPNIDLEAGGTVREWGDTIDETLRLSFDQAIPGHGELTDRAGVRQFQDFVRELAEVGRRAAAANASVEETIENTVLETDTGYESMWFAPYLNRDFVIRRAWEEATGNGGQ
jgi:glyoxylase-like metal-dependent hydrolase (beta-lactamase superfamily II)